MSATLPPVDNAFWNAAENGEAWVWLVNTASLRLYGPPSAVRVVSEFAMFSTRSSARVRCAASPDALTCKAENRLMSSFPRLSRTLSFVDGFSNLFQLPSYQSGSHVETQSVFREHPRLPVHADVVAIGLFHKPIRFD